MDYTIHELTYKNEEMWNKTADLAAGCSWQETGAYFAEKMRKNDFLDWERVFAAEKDGKAAGFCALTGSSENLGKKYSPYVGFVFVDEAHRGNNLGSMLCRKAIEYAGRIGFDEVFLYTDLVNFYEKMGFKKIAEEEMPWGEIDTVYSRQTKVKILSN